MKFKTEETEEVKPSAAEAKAFHYDKEDLISFH